jgi:lipoprotein-anchoring transpeptidase ErfK/SrfK
VHAGFFEADGHTYGVGMPIIMRFSKSVTDRATFVSAVTVQVDGAPAHGFWDWEPSPAPGWAMEAHYRTAHFWPAHSDITVDAPLKGLSAGPGKAFDDSLTLSMRIGAAHISTVSASATAPHMVVRSDGAVVRRLPVSLGAAATPTYRGVKVVEEFDHVEDMEGTPVYWSVRMTNSGEFVHAAPWNSQIGRANLSHGCTNLSTVDAAWFYRFSRLGDVVLYPNAPGPVMNPTDGFGDWNVPWRQWRTGGWL